VLITIVKCMKKENFPVSNIEERLQEANQYKYFFSLDLNSGYYQIAVAPESRKDTAFITTDGFFTVDSWLKYKSVSRRET